MSAHFANQIFSKTLQQTARTFGQRMFASSSAVTTPNTSYAAQKAFQTSKINYSKGMGSEVYVGAGAGFLGFMTYYMGSEYFYTHTKYYNGTIKK